jgi:hypothetical protein
MYTYAKKMRLVPGNLGGSSYEPATTNAPLLYNAASLRELAPTLETCLPCMGERKRT